MVISCYHSNGSSALPVIVELRDLSFRKHTLAVVSVSVSDHRHGTMLTWKSPATNEACLSSQSLITDYIF